MALVIRYIRSVLEYVLHFYVPLSSAGYIPLSHPAPDESLIGVFSADGFAAHDRGLDCVTLSVP